MNDVKGARATITRFFASFWGIVIVGAIIGAIAAFLQYLGNPPNMGVCVACFTRDIAGAIGLHRLAVAQYIRPEIIGFVFGSLIAALLFREFKPRGGSAPIARFLLGMFAMIGALVFLGCPWRTLLRLAGGDGNAILGFAGLALGVGLGSVCLKRGFTLGRSHPMPAITGWLMPLFLLVLLGFLVFKVSFKEGGAIFFSTKGPGAMNAPVLASLGAALIIGFLAQRSRFCTTAAIRNVLLIRDFRILAGLAALIASALVMNLALGQFKTGFALMPISHSNHLWNFLGMTLAGWAFILAGGCPGRQLFMAGEGDGDAAVFVMGMLVGAALAHNLFLAGVPDKLANGAVMIGGPGPAGQLAVGVGMAFCAILGFTAREAK